MATKKPVRAWCIKTPHGVLITGWLCSTRNEARAVMRKEYPHPRYSVVRVEVREVPQ
jgi:hypothetical protein